MGKSEFLSSLDNGRSFWDKIFLKLEFEKKGVKERFVDMIEDLYDGSATLVRIRLGETCEFLWCMLFADDIVLIDEMKNGVDDKL